VARWECDGCGLAAVDLPDGVDPELVFERVRRGGSMFCQGCLPLEGDHGEVTVSGGSDGVRGPGRTHT
jgi:hypothetical protein